MCQCEQPSVYLYWLNFQCAVPLLVKWSNAADGEIRVQKECSLLSQQQTMRNYSTELYLFFILKGLEFSDWLSGDALHVHVA